MTSLNFFRKGTLLIPSGPDYDLDRMHLHVICTNPDATGEQIVVSIGTHEPGMDATCILLKGAHECLKKPQSSVDYLFTRLISHQRLKEGVRQEEYVPKEDMKGQDFLRICKGIERSPRTSQKMKDAYRVMAAAEERARVDADLERARGRYRQTVTSIDGFE